MSKQNPAVADLREMDVLKFLFELKREQIDPMKLQQMLIEHQIQNQIKKSALEQAERERQKIMKANPNRSILSPLQIKESASSMAIIPEPKIVFQYVPSPKFPTPTTSPEPGDSCDAALLTANYRKAAKKAEHFRIEERSKFIKLNGDIKAPQTPSTSSSRDSDSDHDREGEATNICVPLVASTKLQNWLGCSIYFGLPEVVMNEYDKMLRDSHSLKRDVLEALNQEFPVNYEYNPKKSRIRTNYSDPQIAGDRTKNNIASRRSRQRKKFQNQVLQHSLDYDLDENYLLAKQEEWLFGIVTNMEEKFIENNQNCSNKLRRLRSQCGFK